MKKDDSFNAVILFIYKGSSFNYLFGAYEFDARCFVAHIHLQGIHALPEIV